jgi:hypothetical protein
MKLKTVALAALLALSAGGALAQTIRTFNTIGTLPVTPPSAPFSQAVTVPAGSFIDRWNFTFPATGNLASSAAVSLTLNGILGINGLQVSLWSNGTTPTQLATGAQAGSSATLSSIALTGGQSYYYQVTGLATGTSGGAYSLIASASPVPEPETYALFLAGLAAIGFVARRRAPAMGMAPAAA